MDIAILLYPRFTALDAVGPYEVLTRLPGATVTFVAADPGPITTDTGRLTMVVDASLADLPAPEIVVVPGGPGQTDAEKDERVLDWVRQALADIETHGPNGRERGRGNTRVCQSIEDSDPRHAELDKFVRQVGHRDAEARHLLETHEMKVQRAAFGRKQLILAVDRHGA